MRHLENDVREFHEMAGISLGNTNYLVSDKERLLSYKLINEEYNELMNALFSENIVNIADSIIDLTEAL